MSLDNEHFVKLLYRVFLGRDPDEAGYALHLTRLRSGESSHESLAMQFSVCDERLKKNIFSGNTVSDSQERDTDRDWQAIGKSFPYFGVLANEIYKTPTPENLADFFKSGERDVEQILGVIRTKFGHFEPTAGLDFGCGVGRLLIPMAKVTGKAVGVDVADSMLELARAHVARSGVNATVTKEIPDGDTFDWINSFIVFQHIPPSRGYRLIESLWSKLRIGGLMSLHITIYHDQTHLGELLRDAGLYNYDGQRALLYASPAAAQTPGMSMYDYDLSRVLAILQLSQGQEVHLQHTKHGGCHGVIMYLQKTS